MSPLQEQVRSRAAWLFEEMSFKVTADSHNAKAFGNSVVVLQLDGLKIRFIQDRGLVFAEFGDLGELDKWWDLVFLVEAIRGTSPKPVFDIEGVVALLRINFTSVVEAFRTAWPQTKKELERRRQERLQALRISEN